MRQEAAEFRARMRPHRGASERDEKQSVAFRDKRATARDITSDSELCHCFL
jgi:hypothetical protein